MHTIKLLLISCFIIFTMAFTSGCATHQIKVGFDKNSKIETSKYKTFVWLNETKMLAPTVGINTVMKARVENAIEAVFISKGYVLIDDPKKADFAISYSLGNRDKVSIRNYPIAYSDRFNWGRGYHRGRYNHVLMMNEMQVMKYTEGKLAIDVYDVLSHQPVWHGWATKQLTSRDKDATVASVKAVVAQVIAQF
jgi:hypothetical protein